MVLSFERIFNKIENPWPAEINQKRYNREVSSDKNHTFQYHIY